MKEPLWTKDFIFVSIIQFVLMLSMYGLFVTLPIYATQQYDASVSMGGLVASIFIIGALLARLVTGKKAGEYGSKKVLVIGSSILVIATLLYFVTVSVEMMLTVRFLHGIGFGIATTATGIIVAQVMPIARSGEGIGYFSLGVVLAIAVGPFIGIGIVDQWGYNWLFIFTIIMTVVSFSLAILIKKPAGEVLYKASRGFKLQHYFAKKAVPVAFSMFIMALAYSSILSFLTSYTQEIGIGAVSAYYFLIYAGMILLSRPFTGPLIDRKGGNAVAYPALVLYAIGMIILSQMQMPWQLFVAAAFIGLGYGNFQSTTQALAIKIVPREEVGLATSTYFIFLDLGLGFGPLLFGSLIPYVGYSGLYLIMTILILINIFGYYLLHGRKDHSYQETSTLRI